MRIVDRKTFLAMPPGVIYAKYKRGGFSEFARKGETISMPGDLGKDTQGDWYYQDLTPESIVADSSEERDRILFRAEKDPTFEFALDFVDGGRDGCFDEEEQFGVYSEADVRSLIDALRESFVVPTPPQPEAGNRNADYLRERVQASLAQFTGQTITREKLREIHHVADETVRAVMAELNISEPVPTVVFIYDDDPTLLRYRIEFNPDPAAQCET